MRRPLPRFELQNVSSSICFHSFHTSPSGSKSICARLIFAKLPIWNMMGVNVLFWFKFQWNLFPLVQLTITKLWLMMVPTATTIVVSGTKYRHIYAALGLSESTYYWIFIAHSITRSLAHSLTHSYFCVLCRMYCKRNNANQRFRFEPGLFLWWRHDMETLSTSLALWVEREGNAPIANGFP